MQEKVQGNKVNQKREKKWVVKGEEILKVIATGKIRNA